MLTTQGLSRPHSAPPYLQVGLVFLCDDNLKQVEKAQQCSKRPLGQWVFPGDTRGPWGCKGEDGAHPHPAGWQMNGAGVRVVLRTQPAQRWVPAVIQLRGRNEEEMAQPQEGTRVNRTGEGAAQRLVLGGALWGPNNVGSGEG